LRFARFLVVGVVNTAVSYAVYLALLYVIDYRVAYTLAYVAGLAFGYWLQARFVFGAPAGTRSAAAYVATYVTMYAASVLILWVAVDLLGVPKPWAMLVALAVTVPTTFLLLSRGFRPRT
jgi:putative flippase GtrA